jgi:flagellar basal-body rod protein FlgF
VDAMTIAATSMYADIDRVANVGHNLTNLATPGYRSVIETGAALRYAGMQSANLSLMVASDVAASSIDTKSAGVTTTGNATDLAIEGDGFFALQSNAGTLLTRRGDFKLDRDGRLVTSTGEAVLGQSGPITTTSGAITVEADGRVFDGTKQVDQLRVVKVMDPSSLVMQGNGIFLAKSEVLDDATGFRIRQGALEGSNVNSATEMVKLIELVKHIEANQKVMQFQDEILGKSLDKFAEL